MKYTKLREELKKESNDRLKYQLDKLSLTQEDINKEIENGKDMYNHKTPQEILNYTTRWVLDKRTNYKGTYEEQKQKVIIALKRKYNKQLQKELSYLSMIEKAEPLKNRLVITIEWKKSYMWGSNPRASDNFGNNSGSIGGCGYDKRSTATARILNKHLYLIKLMCDKKEEYFNNEYTKFCKGNDPKNELTEEERLYLFNTVSINNNSIHRDVLGYGSGYGIIPRFEGGVGVSCHQDILKKLGYKMDNITSTDNTDVYLIEVE